MCVIYLESSGMSRSLEERRNIAPFPIILDRRPMNEVQTLGEMSSEDHLMTLMVEPAAEKDRNHIARVPWPYTTRAEKPNHMYNAGRLFIHTLGRFLVLLNDILREVEGVAPGVSLRESRR